MRVTNESEILCDIFLIDAIMDGVAAWAPLVNPDAKPRVHVLDFIAETGHKHAMQRDCPMCCGELFYRQWEHLCSRCTCRE